MGQTVPLVQLGELGETVARESGESVGIHRLSGELADSGLLFKRYKKTAVLNGRDAALGELVEFGRSSAAVGRAEREVLLGATSWPVAKVTGEGGELIGCLIPEAGKRFRSNNGKLREIDTLAQTDERLAVRGESVTSAQRLAACRAVVQVAAALERRGLVYSDWNYANALWCPDDCSVFVIDIDGCRRKQMPNVFQSGWEDPLTNGIALADTFTDRYRVALLAARCFTGCRELPSVLHALDDAKGDTIPSILLDMLWAADRGARPASRSLLAVLAGADLRFSVERRPLPPRPAPPVRNTRTKVYANVNIIAAIPGVGAPNNAKPKPHSAATAGVLLGFAVIVLIVIILIIAQHG